MTCRFDAAFRQDLATRLSAFPRIRHPGTGLKAAAVAITLVEADDGSGQAAFLLTRRSASLRAHAGQWALPGGRCDPGETLEVAAGEYPRRSGRLSHPLGLYDRPGGGLAG